MGCVLVLAALADGTLAVEPAAVAILFMSGTTTLEVLEPEELEIDRADSRDC
jgi:hypothetical protein